MASNGKVTLAVLGSKIDQLTELMKEHREEFKEHVEQDRIVAKVVDRLEVAEGNRKRHFWAIYPAIVIGYLLWFMGWK